MNTPAELIKATQQIIHLRKHFYTEQVLGSYQWWLLLGMAILPWVLWLILIDRKQIKSILFSGLIAAIMTTTMDEIGLSLAFWTYPYQLTYFTSWFIPVDLCVIPISIMILYQYCKTWRSYIPIVILFAVIAFLVEPIFDKMNIAVVIHWHYIYSPPFYILIGVISKWLTDHIASPDKMEIDEEG